MDILEDMRIGEQRAWKVRTGLNALAGSSPVSSAEDHPVKNGAF